MQNKFKLVFLIFFFSTPYTQAQEPQWALFFPDVRGPIAVDPNDSDIIYIASGKSFESGMWKTIDGARPGTFTRRIGAWAGLHIFL